MTITAEEVKSALNEIREFVVTPQFQALLSEMRQIPAESRYRFVRDVILNDSALAARTIAAPDGLIIQRSVFMDGRPTLFCVTKYLSDGKRKVTITFDDPD